MFVKGKSGNPAGRKPGTPNRTTSEAKEVALAFLNRRSPQELDALWEAAKAEDPGKALAMWFNALEFAMPKLARTEHVGQDGGPVVFTIRDSK